MQNKMLNFLKSIEIENIDDFDIDFKTIRKVKNDSWEFDIVKKTPWNYDLLLYFMEHLANIKYDYNINFYYNNKITQDEISYFFDDFYKSKKYKDFKGKIEIDLGNVYAFDEDKNYIDNNLIDDFLKLCEFISYDKFLQTMCSCQCGEETEKDDEEFDEYLDKETEDIPTRDDDYPDLEEIEKETIDLTEKQFIKNANIFKKASEGFINANRYTLIKIEAIHNIDLAILSSGKVFFIDKRENGKGGFRFKFGVHGSTKAIFVNATTNKNMPSELLSSISVGDNISFLGYTAKNKYSNFEIYVRANEIRIDEDDKIRKDNAIIKRVELHLHSKMSYMDGVSTIGDYVNRALYWGHKAIALTDHGVVQEFPSAQKAANNKDIKILYGSELYMVDDEYKICYNADDRLLKDVTYVVFDLETTGLSSKYDKIVEFGAVKVKNGLVLDTLDILIDPEIEMSESAFKVNKISKDMLRGQPTIEKCIDKILNFIGDSVLVSHNLEFDYGFLNQASKNTGRGKLNITSLDTLNLSRYINPDVRDHNLGALCRRNEVYYDRKSAHRADYDAEVLASCWYAMLNNILDKKNDLTFNEIKSFKKRPEHIIHSRPKHVCVLAKNKGGLKDLYKIISASHTEYLGKVPSVPRSLLNKLRNNLLVGSACFNGEIFDAASRLSEEELEQLIPFYDYIEIQPLENYSYLLNMNIIDSEETLIDILKTIERLAKKHHKYIVATGDVHYLDDENKMFRDIYIGCEGVGKTRHPLYPRSREEGIKNGICFENPDQKFLTTEEMLDAFKIFGEENAYEYVVTNTNIIADQCETIMPILDELKTPTIENCEQMLRDICYNTAHSLYGENLPEIVVSRLEKELNGIISNGYSVIYYIAHKIIKKTNDDGYIVGSRGSVGSSFVATMANITEVNPLPPHYRCPNCKHFELYEGKDYRSGYDLPEKVCPKCGHVMVSDGQDIPFETFLGFNADKVPDIDLNFPPDYQAKAHEYTKVLLGEKNVYRAGTIGTVAEKTAFGYVKGYYERTHQDISKMQKADLSYLAFGCKDVKRTTGQHPGGIVVIPEEFDVYDFTPIQFPADDKNSKWLTTHFDFHAIHDTILKLDLLGHVDPQALKFLCDLRKVDINDIPITDKKVLSLFSSPEALGLKHNYLECNNGAIALPEFGTDFVRKMLDQTKPKSFGELVIISGLSHGTDVWRNNADELINAGITDLEGVIGCRDDIMTYLISMNLPKLESFKIMEGVRKGRGLSEEQEVLMVENNVPSYYIDSCKKIKYLFPKAHATAYVTMAVRVGWFKVYYPLEFYAAFFSVRCDKYEIEVMLEGEQAIIKRLKELNLMKKERPDEYSKTYEEIEKTLTVSLELYDRGYKFSNVSITKSDSFNFIVDHETQSLIPPFKVVDGLGDNVALTIVNAREQHRFTSIEDLVKRGKINTTTLELFKKMGVTNNLPKSDIEQISLFDF